MSETSENLQVACQSITSVIRNLLTQKKPIVVALDGGSGAGKSTLASLIAAEFETSLIPLDDFFSAQIPDDHWDTFSVEEKLINVFDWKRLRNQVLKPLLAGKNAQWNAFDFETKNSDGSYQMQTDYRERLPADVILIDGAYSASPPIADLIDLKILVEVPIDERHQRLELRENDKNFLAKWHQRWDEAETHYFTHRRAQSSFDVIVRLF